MLSALQKRLMENYAALCSCMHLHKGNALKHCWPVECDNHNDCPINLLCECKC